MAKLNKELQENLKEINRIMNAMSKIDNNFIMSTAIHSQMIRASINELKDGEVKIGNSFYILECQSSEERRKIINEIKKTLGL